jgi:hypothetical protein
LGFTLPHNLAEVGVTSTLHVTTVGGIGGVVNVWSEPLLVPPALVAEILK